MLLELKILINISRKTCCLEVKWNGNVRCYRPIERLETCLRPTLNRARLSISFSYRSAHTGRRLWAALSNEFPFLCLRRSTLRERVEDDQIAKITLVRAPRVDLGAQTKSHSNSNKQAADHATQANNLSQSENFQVFPAATFIYLRSAIVIRTTVNTVSCHINSFYFFFHHKHNNLKLLCSLPSVHISMPCHADLF